MRKKLLIFHNIILINLYAKKCKFIASVFVITIWKQIWILCGLDCIVQVWIVYYKLKSPVSELLLAHYKYKKSTFFDWVSGVSRY